MTHCSALATQHDWRARVRVPLQLRLPPSRLRHRSPAARPAAGSRLLQWRVLRAPANCRPCPLRNANFVYVFNLCSNHRLPVRRLERQFVIGVHPRPRGGRFIGASGRFIGASGRFIGVAHGRRRRACRATSPPSYSTPLHSATYLRRSPSRHRPVPVTPPRPLTSPPRDSATPMPSSLPWRGRAHESWPCSSPIQRHLGSSSFSWRDLASLRDRVLQRDHVDIRALPALLRPPPDLTPWRHHTSTLPYP